jgi:hypothetical protein
LDANIYIDQKWGSGRLFFPLSLMVSGFQNDNTIQEDYYPLLGSGMGIEFPAQIGGRTANYGIKIKGGIGPDDYYYYGFGFTFKINKLFQY